MNFRWIKNLFINQNQNVQKINETNILSIYDTSHIKIPTIKALSKENQEKVLQYLNEIKYDDFQTIVKYSDDLLNKSTDEASIISKVFERYNEKLFNNEMMNNIEYQFIYANLADKEVRIIKDKIQEIHKEIWLRLIALDVYIKKEELRKYDFLGIFGKAEKIRYTKDKRSLLSERDNLKNALVINEVQQHAVYRFIKDNDILLSKINENKSLNRYLTFETPLIDIVELKKQLRIINSNLQLVGEQMQELKEGYQLFYAFHLQLATKYGIIQIPNDLLKDYYNKLDNLFNLYANGLHHLDIYAYKHRLDYQKKIVDIDNLCRKYELMFRNENFKEWPTEEIIEHTDKYQDEINVILNVCKRYISDDVKNELMKKIDELSYYKLIGKSNLDEELEIGLVCNPYIHEKVKELIMQVLKDKLCFNQKEINEYIYKYYTNYAKEEKNNPYKYFPLDELVRDMIYEKQIKYLYNLLRDDFDIYNMFFKEEISTDNSIKHLLIYPLLAINGHIIRGFRDNKRIQALFDSITIKKLGQVKKYGGYSQTSLYEISKILKFIGIDNFDEKLLINSLISHITFNENAQTNDTLRRIYAKIFVDKVRYEDKKENVLTIPNTIKLHPDYIPSFKKKMVYLEEKKDIENLDILRKYMVNNYYSSLKVIFINYSLAKKFLHNMDYEIINSNQEVVGHVFYYKKSINNLFVVSNLLNDVHKEFYKINCYDYVISKKFQFYAVPDNTDANKIEAFVARTYDLTSFKDMLRINNEQDNKRLIKTIK